MSLVFIDTASELAPGADEAMTGPQVFGADALPPLTDIVAALREVRERWRDATHRPREVVSRELPSRDVLAEVVAELRGALFPMRLGPPDLRQENEDWYVGQTIDAALNRLLGQVRLELGYHARHEHLHDAGIEASALALVRGFGAALPGIRALLDSDVFAAYHGDPAARSVDEVLVCYPGVQAVISHRIAHQLYLLGAPLVARIVAEIAHGETGIDIHPGARIGPGFFIDHGTGVVIGETAEIGANVRLYQAVTLGARRFEVDEEGHLAKGGARHPRIEDDVVIYAGATLLGRITVGRGSTIGGNVWLTHSVAPGSRIHQANLRNESGHERTDQ